MAEKICPKHPRYRGRGRPRHECVTCLAMFLFRQSLGRAPIMATKVSSPSAKIYKRKKGKNVQAE